MGIVTFLNGRLKSGIEILLNLVEFDKLLNNTDLVITGEGNLDSPSLNGKVINGIANKTKRFNVPLIAICGGYNTKIKGLV